MNKTYLDIINGKTNADRLKTELADIVSNARKDIIKAEAHNMTINTIDTIVNKAIDKMTEAVKNYSNDISFDQIRNIYRRNLEVESDSDINRDVYVDWSKHSQKFVGDFADCVLDVYKTITR